MESESRDERYAPPQAHVEDVRADSEGLELAGRWRRFWAASVDSLLVLGIFWGISLSGLWNPWEGQGDVWALAVAGPLWGFVLFAVLNGYLLAARGQTIGKLLLGIRVVRPDGRAASLLRLLAVRYGVGSVANIVPGAGMLFALVDCLAIFRKSRRCLHDSIADTIVVSA